jgi:hypothetical protein
LLATLSCTNCGAPLPKQARWTAVTCAHCGAVVAPGIPVIARKGFRAALAQAERDVPAGPDDVTLAGVRYRVLRVLAAGERADVLLATRARRLGERVVLKVLRNPAEAASVEREWAALEALQASDAQGAAHFTLRVPAPVARGEARLGLGGVARPALAVRASPGFRWTLADVRAEYPEGLDPRHAAWMWRRLLELLGWVHRAGWAHGAVEASHVLVDEREHGAILVGWSRAAPLDDGGDAAADLTATARAIRALPGDGVPPALAELLDACAACSPPASDGWLLMDLVAKAARRAFGPPAFVPLHMPRGR